jgi:hypothetical protein
LIGATEIRHDYFTGLVCLGSAGSVATGLATDGPRRAPGGWSVWLWLLVQAGQRSLDRWG